MPACAGMTEKLSFARLLHQGEVDHLLIHGRAVGEEIEAVIVAFAFRDGDFDEVIDLVVATVLMSMGMMMMPPTTFSIPLKLLLFVLVDGWSLVVQSLVHSLGM